MKKTLLALALFTFATASIAACEEKYSYGEPVVNGNYTQLCRVGYSVVYDNMAKIPMMTFEKLTPETIGRGQNHRTKFHEDKDIPSMYRSYPRDYSKSSYDTGHMANAQNASDQATMDETFLMSNMVPQVPSFNRGRWKVLETMIAKQVRAGRELYVITGTFGIDDTKIANNVQVPQMMYKVVIDRQKNVAAAYLLQNEVSNVSYRSGRMAVSDLSKITSINYFPSANPVLKTKLEMLTDPTL